MDGVPQQIKKISNFEMFMKLTDFALVEYYKKRPTKSRNGTLKSCPFKKMNNILQSIYILDERNHKYDSGVKNGEIMEEGEISKTNSELQSEYLEKFEHDISHDIKMYSSQIDYFQIDGQSDEILGRPLNSEQDFKKQHRMHGMLSDRQLSTCSEKYFATCHSHGIVKREKKYLLDFELATTVCELSCEKILSFVSMIVEERPQFQVLRLLGKMKQIFLEQHLKLYGKNLTNIITPEDVAITSTNNNGKNSNNSSALYKSDKNDSDPANNKLFTPKEIWTKIGKIVEKQKYSFELIDGFKPISDFRW